MQFAEDKAPVDGNLAKNITYILYFSLSLSGKLQRTLHEGCLFHVDF